LIRKYDLDQPRHNTSRTQIIEMLDEKEENAKKSDMLMVIQSTDLGLMSRDCYNCHTIGISIGSFLIWCRTCADCGFIIGEGLVKANAALGVFICL
jgi:hypothetical protein